MAVALIIGGAMVIVGAMVVATVNIIKTVNMIKTMLANGETDPFTGLEEMFKKRHIGAVIGLFGGLLAAFVGIVMLFIQLLS